MISKNWTKEEHILAFNLYCKIPFSKINANYPPVKELAEILGRSHGSVAMKLANFARLDSALKARNISGLTQGAKGEEIIWNEFHNNWDKFAYESEQVLAKYKNISVESGILDIPPSIEGKERVSFVKQRVNQNFFRKMILASYNNTCCITGSNTIEFLMACHIKPWNIDELNRMNPQNGLCMNILYHNAFDQGLFTITTDYKILISQGLHKKKDLLVEKMFLEYNGKEILYPQKFIPDEKFLEYHNNHIFKN
ncbi:HNH endonuclease [Bacteroidales bacterium OttesenSCG-928-I14]|nr:HNH endonuclease [Bacteroidales bacterium OttesenSCG-928-I14]